MTVLTIRAHKRFGVCRSVRLHRGGDTLAGGLLIEISAEGCRISNVDSGWFDFEDHIEVEVDGWAGFSGRVRWNHDGIVGLRLTQPLHNGELADLVNFCRGETELKMAQRA